MAEGKTTVVEEGTAFKGAFASDCPIIIKGRIEGEVTGPALTVSSTGAVSGTVRAKEVSSEGEISGEIDADVVRLAGTIKDDTVVRAKSLEVKLNPETGRVEVKFGRCELQVGDIPNKDEALAQAAATVEAGQEAPPASAVEASSPAEENAAEKEPKEKERSGKKGGGRTNTDSFPPPSG